MLGNSRYARGMKLFCVLVLMMVSCVLAQDAPAPRGSIVEDRAAAKLLDAGDIRYVANEVEKAVEIWQSVIERYPRSKVRFQAHMKLGDYFLVKQRAFDRARANFEIVSVEGNPDAEQRAEATLKLGITFYEGRYYGKAFAIFRNIIQRFPGSTQVNHAWYYIGLGHFKQGHYTRAIDALEKVGTTLSVKDFKMEKAEAGKRLYLHMDDRDLSLLEPGQTVKVVCRSKSGDQETIECLPLGRGVQVVLGSISTKLGKATPDNGTLEVQGGDSVTVEYTDEFTAANKFNEKRTKQVAVVSTALVQITNGAFSAPLDGLVIGKPVSLQIIDADLDKSDQAESLTATVEIYRLKSKEELEVENSDKAPESATKEEIEMLRYKKMDTAQVSLTEIKLAPKNSDTEKEAAAASTHSGIFRGVVSIVSSADVKIGDAALQTLPGDMLKLVYADEINLTDKSRILTASARCVEGNLGDVRVTKSDISDASLRLKTQLKTASALTSIGNQYKEFGLADKAKLKYTEALSVCEKVMGEAAKIRGPLLEQAYVQLWRTYFSLEQLDMAAAICDRLMREYPESAFIDEAVLQQALVAKKRREYGRAISLFSSLLKIDKSSLHGEAQFGIGEVYEEMAGAVRDGKESTEQLFEKAFQAYQAVYEKFPESGRVGDSVARMANFYYQKKDYARAIDVFENVLRDHPDANFLDVILFNYGRCLYRLDRKKEARAQFDHLLSEFPDSALASEARQIGEALQKAGF